MNRPLDPSNMSERALRVIRGPLAPSPLRKIFPDPLADATGRRPPSQL